MSTTVNVRHHPKNGPKYEGAAADAMIVRNREQDEKSFTVLVVDQDGKPVKDAAGTQQRLDYVMGSVLDEKIPESCNTRVVVAKSDWERVKLQPAMAHWLREGAVDAYPAS